MRKLSKIVYQYLKRHDENGVDDAKIIEKLIGEGYRRIGDVSEEDVFVVGYPKSGNTWVQHLLAGVAYGMSMRDASNLLVQDLIPDVHNKKFYKRYGDIQFFKSHAFPVAAYEKVIYLVRDGRDVLLSYQAMLNAMGKKVSINELVDGGFVPFPGKWADHLEAWNERFGDVNHMILRYEDLKTGTVRELKRVCGFVGIDRTEGELEVIAGNCNFSNMKNKEETNYWGVKKGWVNGASFVRNGEAGGYRKAMDEKLSARFFELHGEVMSRFGYDS